MPTIDHLQPDETFHKSTSNTSELTLGVVCHGNPADVRNASGLPYFMTRALSKHVGRIAVLPAQPPVYSQSLRIASSISERLLKRKFLSSCTTSEARLHAKKLEKQINGQQLDVILAISADSLIGFLQTDVPIVYQSDATLSAMFDYYPDYSNLWAWSKHQARVVNQGALERSESIIYPSTWAAKSAVQEFSIDPFRVHVIPNGANLVSAPLRKSVLEIDRHRRCELLFVGRDWKRKGGRLAWNTLCVLRKRGIDAHLVVVGCQPPTYVKQEHVTVHGFLSKQDPDQLEQLARCWTEATFFCLPTRAESFGSVLCEAAAYGMPAIATKTGGTAMTVADGVTGRLLPVEAQANEYADAIANIWYDRDGYHAMRLAARNRFEEFLNWEAWARSTSAVIHQAALSG